MATTDSRSPAIQTLGLTKSYGDSTVVDGLDLRVEVGELFGLLGPNGAGKTTTIKMLCCLLRPTSGSAIILGHDIRTDPLGVKQLISVTPQETAIADHLTAWENLSLMSRLHGIGKQQTRRRSEELLELMALSGRADEQVKSFSGGMKRRLSIAMALVSTPKVLFLDEPTIGLDPQSRQGMWEYIAGLAGETTIVLTTHYLEEADALAERIAVIDNGKVVASGTPSELKAGVSDVPVTVVELIDVTDGAIAALRKIYPDVREVNGGVEIEGSNVSVYDIGDCLRPLGVSIKSTYQKEVTLDEVFLDLTGREAPRMKSAELMKRNLKELARDPLSIGVTMVLPVVLLVILQALEGDNTPFFSATMLAPGIALFGLVMLMFSSALILSKDRETDLLSRLLTTPLRSWDFLAAYSVPFLALAVIQLIVVFATGWILGLEINGSFLLVAAILLATSVFFIALGMLFGSRLNVAGLTVAYTVILLLTIFGGTWFDLDDIGGPIQTVEGYLPFTHALDATRDVMDKGAGFGEIATDLYWVIGYAVAVSAAAIFSFKQRMVE